MSNISFSLGYNFDKELIHYIHELNSSYKNKIVEFYASLSNSLLPSARPNENIKVKSIEKLKEHIDIMNKYDIKFNYLINSLIDIDDRSLEVLKKILEAGIEVITVNNPAVAKVIKQNFKNVKVVISSLYGAKTKQSISNAITSGADAIYLDSIYINRDIKLLIDLYKFADNKIELRLYANVSCLSKCPVKDDHYKIFSKQIDENIKKVNKLYFNWCSNEKLKNPVSWIQMQWIRPEDLQYYLKIGYSHFKLSDRLASTDVLKTIAKAYLSQKYEKDLFYIIERGGVKFSSKESIYVDNTKFNNDFIEHFFDYECKSDNMDCKICNKFAKYCIA